MQIKHIFLFLFILGFVWVGVLFALQNGPEAAVNGILAPNQNAITAAFTCAASGCHSSFALNTGGTLIALSGLPAQWNPGQQYPLTVTIQRSASVYGFQLSAVSDSNNAQAGTLTTTTADRNRTKVISGGGVQYAEHSFASPSSTFTVNWTAPASASAGTVRFNLAGNAANGNIDPTGDFIYARVDRVSPAVVAPPPQVTDISTTPNPPVANQSFNFTLTGANFDTTNSIVVFTGPGCSAGCQGAVATRTATQIAGSAGLAAGTFSVVVQNGGGGAASNAVAVAVAVIPFTLANRQGALMTSDGTGNLSVGYARIRPNAGSTTPSGVAIFGLRQNNVLVTEAGVPASPLLTSGRVYADVSGVQGSSGAVDTGFAIANPNNSTATINFYFTDSNGVDTATRQMTVGPNQQRAQFLDQPPINSGANFRGTFTFSSDVPVSVIALRGYYNERAQSEFLITTLPVLDLSASPASGTVYLAHFADGGGWTTQTVLVNPTDTTLTGSIQFLDRGTETTPAAPVTLTAGGVVGSTFNYSIPRRGSFRLVTSGAPATTTSGSVRVVPSGGTASPSGILIFSFKRLGITVSEAGVPGVAPGNSFRMYVEESGTGTNSGIAVTNTTATTAVLSLDLYSLDGSFVANSSVTLGGNGQTAQFLDQFFPGIALPFKGILVISGGASSMSVVSLRSRNNERNDFLITTTPATNEASAPVGAERLFPHLVNGVAGGDLYTTQFILFSGTAGQVSDGNLFFNAQDGSALGLSVN